MNFGYSEAQLMVAQAAKKFAERYVRPHVVEWGESQELPIEVSRRAGDLGFVGVLVPEVYGGSGLDYHDYIAIVEEISKVDSPIGPSIAIHNSPCIDRILGFGNEEQKQRRSPELASGEWIGAWSITEHDTGSDSGGMATTTVRDGDSRVLSGAKNFITHGKSGQITVVIARTGEKGDKHAIIAFVVERGTPDFSGGKKENKLGMHTSKTAELAFQDCGIPDANRLGKVGGGFVQAMKILDGGRIPIRVLSLGAAKGAYKAVLKHVEERVQFGKRLIELQGVGFKLIDMTTEMEASELLLHKVTCQKSNHRCVTLSGAMAKMYSPEMCVRVATEAIQVHGGYGYTKNFPVEKFSRDSKLCTIGEGTTEI